MFDLDTGLVYKEVVVEGPRQHRVRGAKDALRQYDASLRWLYHCNGSKLRGPSENGPTSLELLVLKSLLRNIDRFDCTSLSILPEVIIHRAWDTAKRA